jgi:polyphosphate kinase
MTPPRSLVAIRRPEPPSALGQVVSLEDPSLYVNRELSQLQFQRRVLEEAQDKSNPLLERVKFLGILGSNLDEFFMVRVAGLQNQLDAGIHETGADAMTPARQLWAIRDEFESILRDAHACLRELLAELAEKAIRVIDYDDLAPTQRMLADRYFLDTVFPVLTPLAVDPARPFPHISNLSLNLSVVIRDPAGQEHFARVKVPSTLSQLVPVGEGSEQTFVWIEQVIQANADLDIQELESGDLLESVEEGVRQRRFGAVVRLKVTEAMPAELVELLKRNLKIDDIDIYRVRGPLSLSRLITLSQVHRPDLKDAPFVAQPLELRGEEDIFTRIRRGDVLRHHPFESFQPVIDFLRAAARDPNVLAIKMTLYRVGRNSPVVEALLEAMQNGKQVTVLVELKARFDEESNIEWAHKLEDEGVHVVYGLMGLKTHAKVALVVRREGDVIRRYVHLSTGNYNAVTAHFYTDLGFFTCNPEIGADVTDLFNYLTGYSAKTDYDRLLIAPLTLRQGFEDMIRREIGHAQAGREGHLIFKMNSLVDPRIIRLLYEASWAGVKVDLIVRGICCLRPGIPGVSENIAVRSIVGRFLEHSRVYYFRNGGDEQVYCGSADLMPRNIQRRVEVLFPVDHPTLVRQMRDRILGTYLADNTKARVMLSDGGYRRVRPEPGTRPVNAQALLLETRMERAERAADSRWGDA